MGIRRELHVLARECLALPGTYVYASSGGRQREPAPSTIAIAPKLAGKVLFVAVNINTDLDEGKQFIESLELRHVFPVFLPDENSPALKAYDPDRMPSTFVIDPQGVVRLVQYGYHQGDENKLAQTLGELTKK